MKLDWNSRGVGGGGLEKIPCMGEIWIFSGITQWEAQVAGCWAIINFISCILMDPDCVGP